MGANKEICDARGMNCIDLVENEVKTLENKLKPSTEKTDTAFNLQSSVGFITPYNSNNRADKIAECGGVYF